MDNISTCLFLITVKRKSEKTENVILAVFKEVFEISPKNTTWYKNHGINDKAKVILSLRNGSDDIEFRQWFCILADNDVKSTYDNLHSDNIFQLPNINCIFQLHASLSQVNEEDLYGIINNDIPLSSEYRITKFNYDDYEYLQGIYFDSFKEDFIDNLKIHGENIQGIFPYAFVDKLSLQSFLSDKIIIIHKNLFLNQHFHGSQISSMKEKKDPKEFIGYVDFYVGGRNNLSVCIIDENSSINLDLDRVPIDPQTGLWIYKSEIEIGKGKILFFNNKSNEIIAGQKFALVKSFNVSVVPMSQIANDLYGNPIHKGDHSKSKKIVKCPENRIWYRESFPNLSDMEFEQRVSKYFHDIFIYSSPIVLIYDPYCLGEIKIESDKIKVNSSQRLIINALLHCLAEDQISEIRICCMWRRIKDFWTDNKENLPDGYIKLFKELNKIQPFKLNIHIYDSKFHNRHIIGYNNKEIFNLSTSLNGIITEQELEVRKIDDSECNKIFSRVDKIWNDPRTTEVIFE